MTPLEQHQKEIQHNYRVWQRKPLLQEIYADLYARIIRLIDQSQPEPIVEIGSGIGNLKTHVPRAIATDLFANPWLDLVCDGYKLPFRDHSLSHLILSDVFHHLQSPKAFLKEAQRVLIPAGRLIISEPFISLSSYPIYGLLHHEPVGWSQSIDASETVPAAHTYYAAQGNATRLFFKADGDAYFRDWEIFHRDAYSCFHYFLSGGYSKPQFYPRAIYPFLQSVDRQLSRWPKLFGGRCIVGLKLQPKSR